MDRILLSTFVSRVDENMIRVTQGGLSWEMQPAKFPPFPFQFSM